MSEPAINGPNGDGSYAISADSSACPKCGHAIDRHGRDGCRFVANPTRVGDDGFIRRQTGGAKFCDCPLTDEEVQINLEAGKRWSGG